MVLLQLDFVIVHCLFFWGLSNPATLCPLEALGVFSQGFPLEVVIICAPFDFY